MNTQTKLFSNDPLFWALVNQERVQVRLGEQDINIRRRCLVYFGYGYLRQERAERGIKDTLKGEELNAFLRDALKDNGLDRTQTTLLWQFVKDEDDFYSVLNETASKHDAILTK